MEQVKTIIKGVSNITKRHKYKTICKTYLTKCKKRAILHLNQKVMGIAHI